MINKINISIIILSATMLTACGMMAGNEGSGKGKGLNLFSIEDDKELGAQVAAEIDGNPAEYPLLDSTQYSAVYQYVYKVRDKILNSGAVEHKDDFQWRLRIIHDDSTLNAFCTPGGYIYIYTGILKFLESEDEFAGVLGHEIGHADKRHSTRQMTKMYGVQTLLSVLAGDENALAQISGSLIGLTFSRKHETEADECSVNYLCPTDYNAGAGAGFFQKISEMGGSTPPEFLSTHPNPEDRIEKFETHAITMGCSGSKDYKAEYEQMIQKLPK